MTNTAGIWIFRSTGRTTGSCPACDQPVQLALNVNTWRTIMLHPETQGCLEDVKDHEIIELVTTADLHSCPDRRVNPR